MQEVPRLIVSTAPHIRERENISGIMRHVLVALSPALLGSMYFFGFRSFVIVAVCCAACFIFEMIGTRIIGKPNSTWDLSALVTGVLLAFNLPPAIPLWMVVFGAFWAIMITKIPFGGIGNNIFNPALIGRAVLLTAFPVAMTKGWIKPFWYRWEGFSFFDMHLGESTGRALDALTTATPLAHDAMTSATPLASQGMVAIGGVHAPAINLFLGNVSGCIGETSALLLLIGAAWLFYKKLIYWEMPAGFIGAFILFNLLFRAETRGFEEIAAQVFAGGLILGAFFMATDMVTSPMTRRGQLIAGVFCGFITFLIRFKGGYPEGVSYSILLMNVIAPTIDRYTMPVAFGHTERTRA